MASRALGRRRFLATLPRLVAGASVLGGLGSALAQDAGRHDLTIKVRKHQFSQARIEVAQGDILKITLVAEDVPHSFTVDQYRISKRAVPGTPVTFEFRADRAGTFPFYCNLTAEDPDCKNTRGLLVVSAHRP
ncbi:MAG: cupredoxin domain-containing protein [Acidobacteriota bacterium]